MKQVTAKEFFDYIEKNNLEQVKHNTNNDVVFITKEPGNIHEFPYARVLANNGAYKLEENYWYEFYIKND